MLAGQLPVGEDPINSRERSRTALARMSSPGRLEPRGDLVPVPQGLRGLPAAGWGKPPGPRWPLTSKETDWRLRPVRSATSAMDASSSSTARGSKPSLIS